MVRIKSKPLALSVQAEKIRKHFPDSRLSISLDRLVWKCTLTPTSLSESYDIKLVYNLGFHPCVYVINKKLELFPGKKYLPHVYNTEKQWLCLYYRSAQEWNSQLFIAETIIPWISEWLYHYEFWLATGNWYGRGIHGKIKPFENKKNPSPNQVF